MTLKPDQWEKVKDLFHAALEENPAQRLSFVQEQCPDSVVRAEVERLLAESDEANSFLSSPAVEALHLDGANHEHSRRLSAEEVLSGRFRIVEFIAAGGMGEVYKAEDTRLDRTVALKVLSEALAHDRNSLDRLQNEATAASALNHPNICTVYDFGEDGDQAFIAMEYLDGETLAARIKKSPCPVAEALDIAVRVASALGAAHGNGIIHRDLKPSNIMLTSTGAKLLDFGIARKSRHVSAAEQSKEGSNEDAQILGTLPYMSPERLQGYGMDVRGDIFAFGAVLYEMLTGKGAFKRKSSADTTEAIIHDDPEPLRKLAPGVPEELHRLVQRCLRKDPEERYSTMVEVSKDLDRLQQNFGTRSRGINLKVLFREFRKPLVAIPALLALLLVTSLTVWDIERNAKVSWARDQALPQIPNLIEQGKLGDAYSLSVKAERYIPHDKSLAKFWTDISWTGSIHTTPQGAAVYRRNYADPSSPWEFVGLTPIEKRRFPLVDSLWKFELNGYEPVQRATFPTGQLTVTMDKTGQLPPDMVRISLAALGSTSPLVSLRGFVGYDQLPPVPLSDYLIDKFEVTNQEFKRFVDAGGYNQPKYWKQTFQKDGRVLTWNEAMELFRDATGRPGPATWSNGEYPPGQQDYPVAGVSWYEAAAYAEFTGKSLPTIYHWKLAALPYYGASIIPASNFDEKGPAQVGAYQGASWAGVYDMAGNVKEWALNEASDGKRYILGGAWNEPSYLFFQADARSPFGRSANFGFRCAKYSLRGEEAKAAEQVFVQLEDNASKKPVSDLIFSAYKSLYSYDKTPLQAVTEPIAETEYWKEEKITFGAAYGNERVIAYLFLPKNASPPYQTVLHFTGADAFYERSSLNLRLDYLETFDFIIKSGRAVMFIVFKGMFERWDDFFSFPKSSSFYRDHVIAWSKDLGRSIDYLEARPDIDCGKLAYEGYSMGAAMGVLLPAVEKRLKVLVLISPGFYLQRRLPEADQINFSPRIRIPVLMLNGRFDYIFPVGPSQEPMFRELGTPANDKRRVIYDCGHDIPRNEEIRESLTWLDEYLGPAKLK